MVCNQKGACLYPEEYATKGMAFGYDCYVEKAQACKYALYAEISPACQDALNHPVCDGADYNEPIECSGNVVLP